MCEFSRSDIEDFTGEDALNKKDTDLNMKTVKLSQNIVHNITGAELFCSCPHSCISILMNRLFAQNFYIYCATFNTSP